MPQLLPFAPSIPSQRFGTSLDGTQFIIDARWNSRDAAWFMDIYRDDGTTPIYRGIKIALGVVYGLGRRCVDPEFPRGFMLVVDSTDKGQDATLDDLGVRVNVYFYTPEELAAL